MKKYRLFLIIPFVASFLISCSSFLPQRPERSFLPKDLLIDKSFFPSTWIVEDTGFPYGDNLVSSESVIRSFGILENGQRHYLANERVFRYLSKQIANKKFLNYFVVHKIGAPPGNNWSYVSKIADRYSFGCYMMAGNSV